MNALVIIIFAFTIVSDSRQESTPASTNIVLIQKLNELVSYIDPAFRSIVASIEKIKERQELDGARIDKLAKTVNEFVTQQNISASANNELQQQILLSLQTSLVDFSELKASVTNLRSIEPVCPSNWKPYNSFCYHFTACTSPCNANFAKDQCTSIGGNLTRVRSKKHMDFLLDGFNIDMFLGGSDSEKEGTWIWPDGSSATSSGYTFWNGDKPDPSPIQDNDCMMSYRTTHMWGDISCSANFSPAGFVCELERRYSNFFASFKVV